MLIKNFWGGGSASPSLLSFHYLVDRYCKTKKGSLSIQTCSQGRLFFEKVVIRWCLGRDSIGFLTSIWRLVILGRDSRG